MPFADNTELEEFVPIRGRESECCSKENIGGSQLSKFSLQDRQTDSELEIIVWCDHNVHLQYDKALKRIETAPRSEA